MSKLARALIIGAMVAAMNLAVMTTLAHAQANDQPTSNHNTRRPPTEAQVGEPYRHDHDALAVQGQSADAVERFRQSERASQQQPTIADDTRRPHGQPDWLIPGIGVLAAILALVAGLVVMATRRTGRRVRASQTV